MKEKITKGLMAVERRHVQIDGQSCYTKYKPDFYIDNKLFRAVIEKLGGYVYNVSVGKVENATIFNGMTWLAVHDVETYEDCDVWAERVEKAIYESIGTISPIHIHHPDSLHTWGIEFNRDKPFWDNSSERFVSEARKLLNPGTGWFYQSGSNQPDTGYQFFEYMGAAEDRLDRDEYIVRGAAIEIAKEIGTIVML